MKKLLLLSVFLLAASAAFGQLGGKAAIGGKAGFGGNLPSVWTFVTSSGTINNFCPTGNTCTQNITGSSGQTILIAGLYDTGITLNSVTDSNSDTATQLFTPLSSYINSGAHSAQFLACIQLTTSITSVSANFSGAWSATGPEMVVLQYTGGSCTSDGVTTDINTHSSPWTSNSVTPTAGLGDLLLCVLWSTSATLTYTSPFTLVQSSGTSDNQGYVASAGSQILTSASGSYSCGGTSGVPVVVNLVALKP